MRLQKIYRVSLFFFLLIIRPITGVLAQTNDFTGYTFFINPGHGGLDSNDRHMLETDFWESEGNLTKGLYLRDLLEKMHANVILSRITNTTEDDLELSVIDEMANESGADCFLSIHSNGGNGTDNYPLVLFRGYDNEPVFNSAKSLSDILWQELFQKSNCWTYTARNSRGDWSFYPSWGAKVGLGVLRTLTMPGVLSEGSFHDYIPEGWRLRNADYLHHESWAFLRALMKYYGITSTGNGIIAGTVRDTLQVPAWYCKPGTRDERVPLNGVSVTLTPGYQTYTTDTHNNGYFFFDSLAPGNYTLHFQGSTDYYKDSLPVTVNANQTTIADCYLRFDTTRMPVLLSMLPDIKEDVPLNQEFTLSFNLPMDTSAVQNAIRFSPEVAVHYAWSNENKNLIIKPISSFLPNTSYSFIMTPTACSRWHIGLAAPEQRQFKTIHQTYVQLKTSYPSDNEVNITLYPQIRLCFDAPLNTPSAQSEIHLLNSNGQSISKINEHVSTESGQGLYFFETAQPLEPGQTYQIVIGEGLTDLNGRTSGRRVDLTFTTRTTGYCTGTIVEPFEMISDFWDPEASGSTIGTDNERTTFTHAFGIKRSGIYSGQLDYTFTGSEGGLCRVFDTRKPAIGDQTTSAFGIWVYGDLSYNQLEYWFYSSGSINRQVIVDTIDWAGWDYVSIPYSAIGASGEILFHSLVIRQTSAGSLSGTLWFDDASVCFSSGIPDTSVKTPSLVFGPNPLEQSGSVKITLPERSNVIAGIYTMDGVKVRDLCRSTLQPGIWEVSWAPSDDLANSIYLLRVEITPANHGATTRFAEQWVLAR